MYPLYNSARIASCGATLLVCLGAAPVTATAAEKAQKASEVVVSASRVPVEARKIGSAVTIVTREELDRRGVRHVDEALRSVPGISVSRSGVLGGLTQVRCRGAEGNHTLVLIDGVENANPAAAAEFDFSALMTTRIQRIEVIRGPQTAIWGADAIGCVINIVTDPGRKGLQVAGQAEGGTERTGQVQGAISGGTDWATFSLGGHLFRTAGISHGAEKFGNHENDGFFSRHLSGKAVIKPWDFARLELVGGWTKSYAESDGQATFIADSQQHSRFLEKFGKAELSLTFFDGFIEQIFQIQGYEKRSEFFSPGFFTDSTGFKNKLSSQTNFRAETGFVVPIKHTLAVVFEKEDESVETRNNFTPLQDQDILTRSVVVEYGIAIADRTFLSYAYRYDNNDPLFPNTETWKFSAAYLHKETGTRGHFTYGTGTKNPTLSELFGTFAGFTPNPALKPEEGIGFDLGVEQEFFGGKVMLDVTYFQNRVENLIQTTFFPVFTAVNRPGTSFIRGIEVSGSAEPWPGVELKGHYTYTFGQDGTRAELVRRPKHIASLNVNYRFLDDRANLNLGIQYNGRTRDNNFLVAANAPGRVGSLNAYTLVNLTGSYEVVDGVELFLRLTNLLNQDHADVNTANSLGFAAFTGIRARFDLIE